MHTFLFLKRRIAHKWCHSLNRRRLCVRKVLHELFNSVMAAGTLLLLFLPILSLFLWSVIFNYMSLSFVFNFLKLSEGKKWNFETWVMIYIFMFTDILFLTHLNFLLQQILKKRKNSFATKLTFNYFRMCR